ncbi:MAG: hypothetical protein Q9178_001234 [Gyalolechia marmorata]
MPPTPNPQATSKKRQSCDRCHGQKLRCIRAGTTDADACNRCLRQGAQCVYSSSLPKGRPNMYRLADPSIAPSHQPVVAPVTPDLHRRHQASPFTATADINLNANPNAKGNLNPNVNEDAMLGAPMDTTASASTSTWPWLEPFNWNDMEVDGSEQDSNHWTSTSHTTIDPHTDPGAAFLDAFPSLLGWASAGGNSDGEGITQARPLSPPRLHEHGHGLGSDLFESTSNTVTDKNGPDVGIARLSQLSTRLYPLHQSSCNLADAAGSSTQSGDRNRAGQNQLIDDAAFKSVTGWLVHVSANMDLLPRNERRGSALETTTAGETLHEAFSASHHLLETLRCLQADVVPGGLSLTSADLKSVSTSTGGARLDSWGNFTPPVSGSTSADEDSSYFEKRKGSSSYARPSSQYSNTIIRHLVIACHTLLLNIYVAVLIALQHDADRWNSGGLAGNTDTDAYLDPVALADIRLVLAVQLCSYLIERQHQAVDSYLSPLSGPTSLQQQDGFGSQQASSPGSTTPPREVMTDLRMEVQQRLARLRQSLRI